MIRATGALLFAIAASACSPANEKLERVTVATAGGTHLFMVEVARTPEERDNGLMHRRELDADRGMLLVYDPPVPVWLWMESTYLPLDILFIDADGRIITIANAKPFDRTLIPSGGKVRGALEVRGGTAKGLGIAEGNRVLHPAFGNVP